MAKRKSVFRLVAAALLAVAASPASAQSDSRWTSRTGLWSVDYVSSGWTYGSDLPPEAAQLSLLMVPDEAPPTEAEVRMCAVQELALAQDLPAAEIRQAALDVDAARAERIFDNESAMVVTHAQIDGVAVADVRSIGPDRRTPHRRLVFYLPQGRGALFVVLDCFWSQSLAEPRIAEIDAILRSVRMEQTPP